MVKRVPRVVEAVRVLEPPRFPLPILTLFRQKPIAHFWQNPNAV